MVLHEVEMGVEMGVGVGMETVKKVEGEYFGEGKEEEYSLLVSSGLSLPIWGNSPDLHVHVCQRVQ